jgi:hypothetical protein
MICFIYKSQERITLNGGKGWDGIYYYSMTEQIRDGKSPVVGELPFIRRLGTPFLIARFSTLTGLNILDSALYVNLAGAFISVLLLLFWLRKFFDESWIRCLLCFLFMMAWYAPVRYSFYVPLTSDPWAAVWFMGALLILQAIREANSKNHNGAFAGWLVTYSFVIAIGNLFRESNAILCLLPFFIFNPFRNLLISSKTTTLSHVILYLKKTWKSYYVWQTLFLFIPVLFVAWSGLFIKNHIIVSDQNLYSYLDNVLTCLYTKTLPEYLLGILIAFGPLILLAPLFYNQYKNLLGENQELLVLLLISLLFGYIGGTDTERIFCMSGFPVILLLMGISIKAIYHSTQRWWLYVLFILQTISFRFFWTLPDHTVKSGHTPVPFFGLMSSHVKYLYLYSHFSNYIVNTLLLAEYLILFIATWYVIRHKIILKTKPAASLK